MCRCAERREAVTMAASALVRGDLSAVVQSGTFVLTSARQDAAAAAASLRAAAHARLRR